MKYIYISMKIHRYIHICIYTQIKHLMHIMQKFVFIITIITWLLLPRSGLCPKINNEKNIHWATDITYTFMSLQFLDVIIFILYNTESSIFEPYWQSEVWINSTRKWDSDCLFYQRFIRFIKLSLGKRETYS